MCQGKKNWNEIPKDTIPTRLRIDFGINKNQKQVLVDSITLSYEDKF